MRKTTSGVTFVALLSAMTLCGSACQQVKEWTGQADKERAEQAKRAYGESVAREVQSKKLSGLEQEAKNLIACIRNSRVERDSDEFSLYCPVCPADCAQDTSGSASEVGAAIDRLHNCLRTELGSSRFSEVRSSMAPLLDSAYNALGQSLLGLQAEDGE